MGDPSKMINIRFVLSNSNFAQFSKIKKLASSQNLSLYLNKQRFGATMYFPEGLENTHFIVCIGKGRMT